MNLVPRVQLLRSNSAPAVWLHAHAAGDADAAAARSCVCAAQGTRVGYTGAEAPNPTYNSVCRGDGHTEALRVEFDPKVISYEQLLDAFFDQHMPTRKSKAQYKYDVTTLTSFPCVGVGACVCL